MKMFMVGVLITSAIAVILSIQPEDRTVAHNAICDTYASDWMECYSVPTPVVVDTAVIPTFNNMSLFMEMKGIYINGEPWIFIDPTLPNAERYKAEVHETAHYLGYTLFQLVETCEAELFARVVTAEVLKEEYTDDWKKEYGCGKSVRQDAIKPPREQSGI